MSEIDYKKKYEELVKSYESAEFWSGFVYPDGATPEEIQNELLDYEMVMGIASEVYVHITEGRISKPNTLAREIIGESDEVLNRHVEEALREQKEFINEKNRI